MSYTGINRNVLLFKSERYDADQILDPYQSSVKSLLSLFCCLCFRFRCNHEAYFDFSRRNLHKTPKPQRPASVTPMMTWNAHHVCFKQNQAAWDICEIKAVILAMNTTRINCDIILPCVIGESLGRSCAQVSTVMDVIMASGHYSPPGQPYSPQPGSHPNYNKNTKKLKGKAEARINYCYAGERISRRIPCSHDGACEPELCPCAKDSRLCNAACDCTGVCEREFGGCACHEEGKCCSSTRCACNCLKMDCSPDLCGTSGVKCRNQRLRNSECQPLLIGPSSLGSHAGLGAFTKWRILKGYTIGEYVGIHTPESSGQYLFANNEQWSIDAQTYGNATRFMNCSKSPNVQSSVHKINEESRVLFTALKDIEPYEELFLYYGREGKFDFPVVESGKSGTSEPSALFPPNEPTAIHTEFVLQQRWPGISESSIDYMVRWDLVAEQVGGDGHLARQWRKFLEEYGTWVFQNMDSVYLALIHLGILQLHGFDGYPEWMDCLLRVRADRESRVYNAQVYATAHLNGTSESGRLSTIRKLLEECSTLGAVFV